MKYNILNPANFGICSYDVELFTNEMVTNKDLEKVKNFVTATNKGWVYAFNNKSQGTGLGLSMTYKLITDGLNGKIEVSNKEFMYDNKTYVGAEFIIRIEI